MDLSAFLSWLPAAFEAMRDRRLRKQLLDPEGRAAVQSLLRAVTETTLYINSIKKGQPSSISQEHDLSRIWSEASAALRGVHDDLAKRAHLKASYWGEPEMWDEQMLHDANILLAQVQNSAEDLLGWNE